MAKRSDVSLINPSEMKREKKSTSKLGKDYRP